MGQLIRVPGKTPTLHTFLLNCFSKLPSPHLLASTQTKSNKHQGRVQSFRPSKKSEGANKEVILCLSSKNVCFILQKIFFFHFKIAFEINTTPVHFTRSLSMKIIRILFTWPLWFFIYTLFFFISSKVTLLIGGPTKKFFNALCIKFLLSGFYKVKGKMNLSINEQQRGLGCDSNSRNEFCTVGQIMCNRMLTPPKTCPSQSLGSIDKNGNVVNVWVVWLMLWCVLTHLGGRGGCCFPEGA